LLICYTLLLQEKDVWVILFGPGGMCVFGQWTHVLLLERYFPFSRTFCQIKRKDNKKTGHWVGGGGGWKKKKKRSFFVLFLLQETFSSHDCEGCCCSPWLISIKDGKKVHWVLDIISQGAIPWNSLVHPSIVQTTTTTTTKRGL
jgi:hypothetical protein